MLKGGSGEGEPSESLSGYGSLVCQYGKGERGAGSIVYLYSYLGKCVWIPFRSDTECVGFVNALGSLTHERIRGNGIRIQENVSSKKRTSHRVTDMKHQSYAMHYMLMLHDIREYGRADTYTTREMCWGGEQHAAVATERRDFLGLMDTTMKTVATHADPLYGNKTYVRKTTTKALDWFGPRSLSVAGMHLFRHLRKEAGLPDIPGDELSSAGFFRSDDLDKHNKRDTRPVSASVTVDAVEPVESPAVSAHASVPGSSGSSGSSGGVTGSVGSGSVVNRSLSPTALSPRPVSCCVVGRGWSSTAVFPRVDQLTASPSPSKLVGGDASGYGTPQRARAVRGVHLLASDILTPMNSQAEREAWAGLTDGHFDFGGRRVGDIFLSPE